MTYEKMVKDGKVAVLYTPGYGAGWYSWNTDMEWMLFDREIVEAVLAGDTTNAAALAVQKGGGEDVCVLGADNLMVKWVSVGAQFEVNECNGYESIHVIGERTYLVA
jgi:hypothetical protein